MSRAKEINEKFDNINEFIKVDRHLDLGDDFMSVPVYRRKSGVTEIVIIYNGKAGKFTKGSEADTEMLLYTEDDIDLKKIKEKDILKIAQKFAKKGHGEYKDGIWDIEIYDK